MGKAAGVWISAWDHGIVALRRLGCKGVVNALTSYNKMLEMVNISDAFMRGKQVVPLWQLLPYTWIAQSLLS